MATREWTVKLENDNYRIELQHGYFSGKRIININGTRVLEDKRTFDTGDLYAFNINGHDCLIWIKVGTLLPTFSYDLIIDGISQEKGNKSIILEKIKEENEKWAKIKEKGKIKYVIIDGALKKGLAIGILASSASFFGKNGFDLFGVLGKELILEIIYGSIPWIIVGCIEALLMWKHNDKKYQNPYKQINL